MRSMLRILALTALICVTIPAQRNIQAASIMVGDQAVQMGYVAVEGVTADQAGTLAIRNADGAISGKMAIQAGENGRVTVKIDVMQATPALTAAVFSGDSTDAQPAAESAPFNIAMIAVTDVVQFQPEVKEITLPRVISPVDGWVSLHDLRPDDFSDRSFGVTAVKAGLNENVIIKIAKPASLLGREMAISLNVDDGEKGKFEFPAADMPVLVGNGIVDETIGMGEYWVRAGDTLLGADRTVVVPAAGSKTEGILVIRTGGDASQILGYTPMPPGLNRDVSVKITAEGTLPPKVFLQVYPDKGEIGKLEVPGVDGDLEDADFSPDTYPVLISREIDGRDQSAAMINAMKGLVVTRIVADQPVWLLVRDFSKDDVPDVTVFKIGAGVHRNVFIPLKDPVQAGASFGVEMHVDAGKIGEYEYPGPDERVPNANGQFVRDNVEVLQ